MRFKLITFCLIALVPWNANCWEHLFNEGIRQDATKPVDLDCLDKARLGDCDFFACFDQRHSCPSATNFAIKYGLKYCSRFESQKDHMTREGLAWLNTSRVCLMERLIDYYNDDSIDCVGAKADLKERLADCEAEAGLCSPTLLVGNRDIFNDVYGFNRQSVTFFMSTVTRHCGAELIKEIGRGFGRTARRLRDFVRSDEFSPILDHIMKYVDRAKDGVKEHLSKVQESISFLIDDIDF